jgi:hypothetical protein
MIAVKPEILNAAGLVEWYHSQDGRDEIAVNESCIIPGVIEKLITC